MIDHLQSWSDHLIPGPALDIGAGDGEISRWLAAHGFSVDALEPDPVQAQKLRATLAQVPIRLHQLDVLDFPIDAHSYTLIAASAVLHFIDPREHIPLAARIGDGLIPGGMFFAAAFTFDDPASGTQDPDDPGRVQHFFSRGELSRLFQALDVLYYEESRRAAPDSSYGYRSGATLIARRPNLP